MGRIAELGQEASLSVGGGCFLLGQRLTQPVQTSLPECEKTPRPEVRNGWGCWAQTRLCPRGGL